jgi:ribonuclease HIII
LNRLTAAEVCTILKECATTKVSKITFGDLCVEFGTSIEKSQQTLPALTQEQHDKLNDAQVQSDARGLRQQEIDELILTDPELYEELLQKGELNVDR